MKIIIASLALLLISYYFRSKYQSQFLQSTHHHFQHQTRALLHENKRIHERKSFMKVIKTAEKTQHYQLHISHMQFTAFTVYSLLHDMRTKLRMPLTMTMTGETIFANLGPYQYHTQYNCFTCLAGLKKSVRPFAKEAKIRKTHVHCGREIFLQKVWFWSDLQ